MNQNFESFRANLTKRADMLRRHGMLDSIPLGVWNGGRQASKETMREKLPDASLHVPQVILEAFEEQL